MLGNVLKKLDIITNRVTELASELSELTSDDCKLNHKKVNKEAGSLLREFGVIIEMQAIERQKKNRG